MSEPQTEFVQKPSGNGSSIFGVSVRGWLAIVLVTTVCSNWTANTIMMALGWTSANTTVPEPIYSLVIGAVAYYFGQTSKK